MKRIVISLVAVAFIFLSSVHAQRFGIEAGAISSRLDAKLSVPFLSFINIGSSAESEFGVYIGPTIEYQFSDQFSIGSALFYNLRSSSVSIGNVANIDLNHSSLELPLRLNAHFPVQNSELILQTGPSLHVKLDESLKLDVLNMELNSSDFINIDATQDVDVDWKFGAGVRFADRWTVLGQYSLGITDMFDSGILDVKFNYFSLGVNYAL